MNLSDIPAEVLARADKIEIVISYIFRIAMFFAMVWSAYQGNWMNAFGAFLGVLLTFLPSVIERNAKVLLPTEFELLIVFFMFASIFLGEMQEFYTRFLWWDIFLHTLSGMILGFAGFLIVYILNHEEALHLSMAPRFVAIFSFAFALSLGVLWEMFEFASDSLLGTAMQHSSLTDTMTDLIVDALGALAVSLLGFIYVKKGESRLINWGIVKFVEKNPRLFSRKKRFLKLRAAMIRRRESFLKFKKRVSERIKERKERLRNMRDRRKNV